MGPYDEAVSSSRRVVATQIRAGVDRERRARSALSAGLAGVYREVRSLDAGSLAAAVRASIQDLMGRWRDAALQSTATAVENVSVEVSAAWEAAAASRASLAGLEAPVLSANEPIPSARSGIWRTSLGTLGAVAAVDIVDVLTRAAAAGLSPEAFAASIDSYVTNGATFRDAFKGNQEILQRPQVISPAGRTLGTGSARVIVTEAVMGRAEAEVVAMVADPFVEAVRWVLSPNRGTQVGPDVCDALASTDWYGLGPGIYPVDRVPMPPHPNDRCERIPVQRGVATFRDPKPSPNRIAGAPSLGSGQDGRVTEARGASIRQSAERAITELF